MPRSFPHPNYEAGFACPICRSSADFPVVLVPTKETDDPHILECEQVHEECYNVIAKMRKADKK